MSEHPNGHEHRGLLTGEHFMLGDHACAEGAILAARWIAGKKGFFDFRQVFREIVGIK